MRPQPLGVEDAGTCPCHTVVLPGTELVEGHILSTEPRQLASPYLRDILAKGKKYRLQQPVASVFARMNEGLGQYTAHKKRGKDDSDYHGARENWAAAVIAKDALVPDQGREDRAHHAMFFACGHLNKQADGGDHVAPTFPTGDRGSR